MNRAPLMETERLRLEPLGHEHAEAITPVIGHPLISDTTSSIPHPYTVADAHWFADHVADESRHERVWVMLRKDTGTLVGGCGLVVDDERREAELGYWVGVDHWGNGYATEGGVAALGDAFGGMALDRVHACFYLRNPSSGRVLVKLGMTPCDPGSCADFLEKNGVREPIQRLDIARDRWRQAQANAPG